MIDKNKIYMKMAYDLAELSHCVSHKVGVLLVKDGRILSTGINGTPKNFKNCDQIFSANDFDREKHHEFSENYEIHAETNALLFAAEHGISIKDAIMYSTLHPCNHCLKMICNSGIKKIYYCEDYDLLKKDDHMDELLEAAGITLMKMQL